MCGIAGYIGKRNACDVIVNQLKKIEYRGYDSVGLSVLDEKEIITVKTTGRVVNLEKLLQMNEKVKSSSCGFGHTRWRHTVEYVKKMRTHIQQIEFLLYIMEL